MGKKIDSNMPLPSNTKYKWHECFAKLMLERKIFNEPNCLEIVDKPDLQNKKTEIGIEVTTAVDKDSLKMERLYIELEYGLARNEEKVKNKIEKLGGKLSNGILVHPGKSRTLNNIYNSFFEKLLLLNNGDYTIFEHNHIFITDENIIHESELDKIILQFIFIQEAYKYKFEKAYIYIYGDKLYEFNLKQEKYNIYQLSSNEVYRISVDARTIVEQKEMEM